jgi:membrane associated rhomboid family serine protease
VGTPTTYISNVNLIRRPLPFRQFNVALILIGVNVLIFIVNQLVPQSLTVMAMNPYYVLGESFWWQIVSYMFVHGGLTHILFNMLGLFFFGTQVEQRMGSYEFLLFYMFTGVLAGLFSLGFYAATGNYMVFLVGASGAVFGVLLAFATFFPEAMIYVFGIIPIRAPILVLGYTAIELFSQFSGAGGNVAHFTHLAGFAFAYLYFLVRLRVNPVRVFLDTYR